MSKSVEKRKDPIKPSFSDSIAYDLSERVAGQAQQKQEKRWKKDLIGPHNNT